MSSNWTTNSVAREEKCFDAMFDANEVRVRAIDSIDVMTPTRF